MSKTDNAFMKEIGYQMVASDDWDRIKYAAMRRASAERSEYISGLVSWIIKRLRKALHGLIEPSYSVQEK
ncbi:MAG: hypothetical protein GKS00_07820 [Alphaproteobacteria bacterium]|nr:hypothetical protein [Alphaproteobacteria bacterium]